MDTEKQNPIDILMLQDLGVKLSDILAKNTAQHGNYVSSHNESDKTIHRAKSHIATCPIVPSCQDVVLSTAVRGSQKCSRTQKNTWRNRRLGLQNGEELFRAHSCIRKLCEQTEWLWLTTAEDYQNTIISSQSFSFLATL